MVQKEENKEENRRRHGIKTKRKGVGGTFDRKPKTLFLYNTDFKCCFGIFFNKTWD
jgi:hypothetical protein